MQIEMYEHGMSLAINVQSSVTKRFYQEVAIRDKQSIKRFEFRCDAAQRLRSVCKRALIPTDYNYRQSLWRLVTLEIWGIP